VAARYSLWTRTTVQPVVVGVREDRHEVLVTQLLDGVPDHRTELPGHTLWPLVVALATGVTWISSIFTPWGVPVGGVLVCIGLIGWYWPRKPHREELANEQPRPNSKATQQAVSDAEAMRERAEYGKERAREHHVLDVSELPVSTFGSRDPLWWGVMGLMAIEGTVFVLLWISYGYLREQSGSWPLTVPSQTSRIAGAIGVALLLASCAPMAWAGRAARTSSLRGMRIGLALSTLLGLAFLASRYVELRELGLRWDSHAHGSLFWTLLGMHTLHMIVGPGENALLLATLARAPVEEKHLVDVAVNSLYWYFVVAMGVISYALLYFDPALLR
jgi:heme/copper-type cytochrome/quinol oxidase subunit 3